MNGEIGGMDAVNVEAGLRGLIKSMVALAASDRKIDEREVQAIGTIFNDLTGLSLDPTEVRRAAEAFRDEEMSIQDMLKDLEEDITPTFKETIIKACYLVSMADEILVPVELDDVRKVGRYLKIKDDRVNGLITEIEGMMQESQPYH